MSGDDIVERLRHMEPRNIGELRLDAADEIERLTADLAAERAEVERLREQRPTLLPSAHELLTDEIDRLRAEVERLRAIVEEQHDSLVRLSKDAAINHALRTERITERGPS